MPLTDSKQIVSDMAQEIYNTEREYTEQDLGKDATWIEASRMAYKYFNNSDFNGTDEEAAKAGFEMMGEFNYNMALGTIPMAAKIGEASDEQKLAFYYMMDTYDKKDVSAAGVGRFFKNVGLDPTTYIGIGTLGFGFAGKAAGSQAAKAGLKEMLKQGAKKYLQSTTTVAATEGAIYTAADDIARQNVAVEAGMQEEIDPTQTAAAAGIGAAGGAGLAKGGELAVKGVKAGVKQIGKWAQEGEELAMQAAGGGTPPKYVFHGSTDESIDALEKDFKILSPEEKMIIGGTGAGKIGLSLTYKPSIARKYSTALGGKKIGSFVVNENAKIYYVDADGRMIDEVISDAKMKELQNEGYDAILDTSNNTEFEYRALTENAIKKKANDATN